MKPTTIPESDHTNGIREHLRFIDTPGPAPLDAMPFLRCNVCDGVGRMDDLTCPECQGAGGDMPHSTRFAVALIAHVQKTMKMESGILGVGDLISVLIGADDDSKDSERMRAYRQEHLPCYLGGMALALRGLIAIYVREESEADAIANMHRELDGIWEPPRA